MGVEEQSRAERLIEAYLADIQHVRDTTRRGQEHEDNALTWMLALMGGALLALPTTLQALDLHVEWTRRGYLVACAPWIFGLVAAMAGRVCYRQLQIAEDNFLFQKMMALRRLTFSATPDVDGLHQITTNTFGDMPQRVETVNLWTRWMTYFFYLTHGLLVDGLLAISVFIIWRTLTR